MNKACVVDISNKLNTEMVLPLLEQSDFIPQVLAVKSDNDSPLSTSLYREFKSKPGKHYYLTGYISHNRDVSLYIDGEQVTNFSIDPSGRFNAAYKANFTTAKIELVTNTPELALFTNILAVEMKDVGSIFNSGDAPENKRKKKEPSRLLFSLMKLLPKKTT